MKMRKLMVLFACLFLVSAAAVFSGGQRGGGQVNMRLSWWGGEERHQATLKVIELYQQKNPNVKIEAEYGGYDQYYEKLVTQLAGGTAPDLIQLDHLWFYELNSRGEIFLSLDGQMDLSAFDANFLKNWCTYNGRVKGLPTGLTGESMLIDRELLQKSGVNPDTVWDWNTIVSEGRKINAADPSSYFFNLAPTNVRAFIEHYFAQLCGGMIDSDRKILFTERQAEEVFRYFKQWIDNKVLLPVNEAVVYQADSTVNPDWINGKMVSNFSWSTELNRIMGQRTNMVPVEMPVLPNPVDTGIVTRPAQLMMVNNASPNREEAVKFLTYFFYDPEASETLGTTRGVPASSVARQLLSQQGKIDPKVELITNFSLAKAGKPQSAWQTNSEIVQIMDTVVERFWYGQLTPAQAARQLGDELTAKLAALR